MKRLKVVAEGESEKVKILLDRISKASENLSNNYFGLFDNLNTLYENYPNLYKQLEMVVDLPSNEDAKNIVQLKKDIERIMNNLDDESYLNSYL